MKTYQSVLPAASRRECGAERTRERHLAREIKGRLAQIFADGFHYCHDCQARCERIEGENGQPSRCDRCGSPKIDWNPPLWLSEPTDFFSKEAA
jgi:hypothetical protein